MSQIEFREPVYDDLAYLIWLNKRYKNSFLADGESFPDDIEILANEYFNLEVLAEKRAIVFTAKTPEGEEVIGSADFTHINHDLTAVLHFIMHPKWVRQFLADKVYLDALLDRFRVIGVRKFMLESEFFCKSAHKIAEAIGFKKVATLTDIIRKRKKVGDTYQFVVGDLYYYELTRKDLRRALAEHFIAEESEEPEPPQPKVAKVTKQRKERSNVQQQSKQKRTKSVKTAEPVEPVREPVG